MATRLLLLSDTHVPARARELPPQVWEAVDAADVIVHAGDWVDLATFEVLAARAPRLVGVYGNNDGTDLRERMPEVARFELDGIRFAVVHETGTAAGREARADERFTETDVLVFGHSHIPWDAVSPAGMRLLNPGSPTDRRRQPASTFITAVADAGALRDVELVEVRKVTPAPRFPRA
ncbi:metallophosphoesterase family protein [Glaciibacter superstes]|uniref:metallophosphoesterase family protein n=1 Tax=Glaciibacter superstes TaxID=501023 RepID=UPI0003B479A9|nr:metallophosphoesterase [Glaciibacter superstes]